jgi:predicted alpha/beta-fold hydrolase
VPPQRARRVVATAAAAAAPLATLAAAAAPQPMLALAAGLGLAAAAAAWAWAWLDARAKTGPVEVFAPAPEPEQKNNKWAKFHALALARCAALQRPYAPAPFFTNPHAETILAAKLRAAPEIDYRREILRTSDGGAVALDWEHCDAPAETTTTTAKTTTTDGDGGAAADAPTPTQKNKEPVAYGHDAMAERENRAATKRGTSQPPLPDSAPLLILFPGLTGGSGDSYVRHCVASARERGVRAVVFNSRGTAESPVLTPQFYSASFTQDAREVVQHVRKVYPAAEAVYAVGWSLGGNILLRYLGEEGQAGRDPGVEAAVSLCNPFDLTLSNAHLKRDFFGRLYDANLANSLRRIFGRHAATFKEAADAGALKKGVAPERVAAVRTIADFDECITAPTFGWPSVSEYYRASSSALSIPHVRVPLLCVQAADDPIAPEHAIPRAALSDNPRCALVVTRTGGHLGWVTAEEGVRGRPWTDGVVVDWLGAVHEALGAERRRNEEEGAGRDGAVGATARVAAAAAVAAK